MKLFNNKIKSAFLLGLLTLTGAVVSCDDDTATENSISNDHIGFVEMNETISILGGESTTVNGTVYASGTANTDRVISLELILEATNSASPVTTADAESITIPSSVTIPAGSTQGTFPITIAGDGLAFGADDIVIAMVDSPNFTLTQEYFGNFGDENYEVVSQRLVLNARQLCALNAFRVEIVQDAYGSETTWELYNQDDLMTPIASGGPYTDLSAAGTAVAEVADFCLEDGSYAFVAYDSYGDGMSSGAGEGYYALHNLTQNGEISNTIAQNGQFAANDVVFFDLP